MPWVGETIAHGGLQRGSRQTPEQHPQHHPELQCSALLMLQGGKQFLLLTLMKVSPKLFEICWLAADTCCTHCHGATLAGSLPPIQPNRAQHQLSSPATNSPAWPETGVGHPSWGRASDQSPWMQRQRGGPHASEFFCMHRTGKNRVMVYQEVVCGFWGWW